MINFPLLPPTSPNFSAMKLRMQNIVAVNRSPFTAQQQTYLYPGEWWEADVSLPPIGNRAQAEQWLAFLASLRGQYGTFLLGDPLGRSPSGAAKGAPLMPPAAMLSQAQSNTLQLAGWDASVPDILLPGDYIEIGRNFLTSPNGFSNAVWIPLGANGGAAPAVAAQAAYAPYGTGPWQAAHQYNVGDLIVDSNGSVEECTHAGTSGSTAPIWNATVGGTTTDNTVQWTNEKPYIGAVGSAVGLADAASFPVLGPGEYSFLYQIVPAASIPILAAGQQFSFGVWMRAQAQGGAQLYIDLSARNGAVSMGGMIAQPCNLTTSWAYFQVTGTLSSADAAAANPSIGVRIWAEGPDPAQHVYLWGASLDDGISRRRLHKVLTEQDTDANGLATFDIFPVLRETPDEAAPISVQGARGMFRLAANTREFSLENSGLYGISFKAVEAF